MGPLNMSLLISLTRIMSWSVICMRLISENEIKQFLRSSRVFSLLIWLNGIYYDIFDVAVVLLKNWGGVVDLDLIELSFIGIVDIFAQQDVSGSHVAVH